MADAKCFNDDVASVGLAKGQEQFAAGKAAMTLGTDGSVRQWAKDLGADNLILTKWPIYGTGPLKDAYNATQSTSYFVTSWSKHQKEAADFLAFLHTPEMLDVWYKAHRHAAGRRPVRHREDHRPDRQAAVRLQHDRDADLAAELLPAAGRPERQRTGPAARHQRPGRCGCRRPDPGARRRPVAGAEAGRAEELAGVQAGLVM